MDYLTKEGLEQIKRELEELRTIRRAEIANRLKEAASFGDLSENAEYVEAKEAEAFLETRIGELEETLRNYRVVDTMNKKTRDSIDIGCAVEVEVGQEKHTYHLVGKEEADPLLGKVSANSPIGRSLMGKRAGDFFEVFTPNGTKKFRITKIA